MMDSIWTKERVAAFQKFCGEKTFSFTEIAEKLSADFGVVFDRNMCIGKAHRMGIGCDRPSRYLVKVKKIKLKSERKPRLIKTGFATFSKAKIESVEWKLRAVAIVCETAFDDVTGCRYPAGDRPYLFCNGKRQDGSSYCTAHHALCREPPKLRGNKYLAAA